MRKPMPRIPLRPPSRRSRRLVGLDIEPGAIHVAEAAPGPDGRPVVQRAATRALEPGIVRDGEIVDGDALAAALREVFEAHGFDRRVRIGVANQRIVVRTMELPPISDPKELAQAVAFQAPAEVPMPLDQAVVDHVPLGIVETPEGPRARVMLVAARRELIDRVLSVARQAGLKPEGVDLAAFALVRSLGDRSDSPVAYLAIGGSVNLVVSRGGHCLFTRVIAGGLETLAIELAERRQVPVEQARVELAEGLAPESEPATAPEPSVAQALLADGVRRIAGEVRTSLDFHLSGDDAAVQRLVVTGAGAAVPGVAEGLAEHLLLPVQRAAVAAPDDHEPERFTVAAGLTVEELAA